MIDLNLSPLVSVVIPCYEMHGRGAEFLTFSLARIAAQSYSPIEVVVSDHSKDHEIAAVCENWQETIPLRYVRNPERRGSSSANVNVAIQEAQGLLIKILCQDDFLFDPMSINQTVAAFRANDDWLVTSYLHTEDRVSFFNRHVPRITPDIAVVNTIGTHSCLTIRNVCRQELFDEELIWAMDCEYYRRLYDRFGPPRILDKVTVAVTLWDGQVTNTYASDERLRQTEIAAVRRRHPEPLAGSLSRQNPHPAGVFGKLISRFSHLRATP